VAKFIDFIKKNITGQILASLLIYNILNVLVSNVISPLIFTYADPDDMVDKLNFTTDGTNTVMIGTFIKTCFVGFSLLFILSQLEVIDGK
tara:strand:- start:4076 stop:4345 length:270 start_codon:yes stop_codon:yes gene_type:complete